MIDEKLKAKWFDTLIDNYCDGWGVRECIGMLRTQLELTDQELVELGFDVNDL